MAATWRRHIHLIGEFSLLCFLFSISAAFAIPRPARAASALSASATVEGELEVRHYDNFRKHASRFRYYLNTAQGRVALHFKSRAPKNLLTGSWVRARGTSNSGVLTLDSGANLTAFSTAAAASAAPLPNTFGPQQTLVLLINFQDDPTNQPFTPAQAQTAVFSWVSNYLLEASYQQTSLTGNVVGWITIPMNSTSCDGIDAAADTAASAAGVDLSSYSRILYMVPEWGCGYGGWGTIGGTPSRAMVSGPINVWLISHELGHNLGLYHSHVLTCPGASLGSNCTSSEYGDTADLMGNYKGHYNSFQKERLGWLNYSSSPPITTVDASGEYSIDPYETVGTNPKALKVFKGIDPATGANTWYYVEYRQAIGYDAALPAYLPNSNLTEGVLVHTGTDNDPDSSELLDMTPGSYAFDFDDAALLPGQTFNDPASGVAITTEWANATNAGVQVTIGSAPSPTPTSTATSTPTATPTPTSKPTATRTATPTPPQIKATPSPTTAPTRTATATATATATPTATVTATPTATATAKSGPSPTVTATLTPSPTSTVTATATSTSTPTPTSSATPDPTVTTDKSTYVQGAKVYVTAVVTSNGKPLKGVNVSFTVTPPSGGKFSASNSTNPNGIATVNFTLQKNAPLGVYNVLAFAKNLNQSAATTFSVIKGSAN